MLSKLPADLKQAQLNREETKVSTLRMLLSEIKNAEIANGKELEEDQIISILQKEVKKRKEAAAGFRQGNREGAALKEEAELKILEEYLPKQLSDEELTKIVEEAITQTGASAMSDMGKVIGIVMGKVSGQADGGRVSSLVKTRLSS